MSCELKIGSLNLCLGLPNKKDMHGSRDVEAQQVKYLLLTRD